MRKFVCTNCGHGWVVPALLKLDRTPIWLCDECDAVWFGAEQPTQGAEDDLSTYLTGRGLPASLSELEFLPVPPRVVDILHSDLDRLVDEVSGAGWRVFRLPEGIRDATAFCTAIVELVPLDPPHDAGGAVVWHALAASLMRGLYQNVDSDRIAIVWPTPRDGASAELEEAMSVLEQAADTLSKPELTDDHPKQVLIFTTGHIATARYDDER